MSSSGSGEKVLAKEWTEKQWNGQTDGGSFIGPSLCESDKSTGEHSFSTQAKFSRI